MKVEAQGMFGGPIVKSGTSRKGKPTVISDLVGSKAHAFYKYGLGQFIRLHTYSIGAYVRENHINKDPLVETTGEEVFKIEDERNKIDSAHKRIDFEDFDAKNWARQAKKMGARYVICTTKQDDGIALRPCKFSINKDTTMSYRKDNVKEIVNAYTAEGIDVFFYFAIMGTRSSNLIVKKPITNEEKRKSTLFWEYTKNQISELLDHYPQVKGMWLDGTCDPLSESNSERIFQLEKDIRKRYPNFIIGLHFRSIGERNRFYPTAEFSGYATENWSSKFSKQAPTSKEDDREMMVAIVPKNKQHIETWSDEYFRSTNDIIELMMKALSNNENFVLGFCPDELGNMQPGENKIARELGEWMVVNHEAVYDVRNAVGFQETAYGYYTQKEHALYLTVFNRPNDNKLRLVVNKDVKDVPLNAYLLSIDRPLDIKQPGIYTDGGINHYYDIQLPHNFKTERPFVIKICLGPVPKSKEIVP
ncbi:MAG: alpha-L-fucosidase [Sphingobacterium sp.]|jgi:alpha-L-fucosidase|nr:alpha-L-fucosidase [Sphingobacterium sp.]